MANITFASLNYLPLERGVVLHLKNDNIYINLIQFSMWIWKYREKFTLKKHLDDETKLNSFLKFEYATILDCFISEFEGCAMTKICCLQLLLYGLQSIWFQIFIDHTYIRIW